jgi:hypothetical protein
MSPTNFTTAVNLQKITVGSWPVFIHLFDFLTKTVYNSLKLLYNVNIKVWWNRHSSFVVRVYRPYTINIPLFLIL